MNWKTYGAGYMLYSPENYPIAQMVQRSGFWYLHMFRHEFSSSWKLQQVEQAKATFEALAKGVFQRLANDDIWQV